jgi:hypothetical protein
MDVYSFESYYGVLFRSSPKQLPKFTVVNEDKWSRSRQFGLGQPRCEAGLVEQAPILVICVDSSVRPRARPQGLLSASRSKPANGARKYCPFIPLLSGLNLEWCFFPDSLYCARLPFTSSLHKLSFSSGNFRIALPQTKYGDYSIISRPKTIWVVCSSGVVPRS